MLFGGAGVETVCPRASCLAEVCNVRISWQHCRGIILRKWLKMNSQLGSACLSASAMLLTSHECARLLAQYHNALLSRARNHRSKNAATNLLALDEWRLSELSQNVRDRSPSFMTKE